VTRHGQEKLGVEKEPLPDPELRRTSWDCALLSVVVRLATIAIRKQWRN